MSEKDINYINDHITSLEYQKNEYLSCILIMKDILKIEFTEEEIKHIGDNFNNIKDEEIFLNTMIYYTNKLMQNMYDNLQNDNLQNDNIQNNNIQNHSEYHYSNEL